MSLFSQPPKSICILRLSALGDVCNTIAAVQAIQSYWPSVSVTWVTGGLEAKLIRDLPGVDVVVFDKKAGWRGYTQLWKQLKDQQFDALLHMQYAFRASIATLGIKAKYKLGFDKARSQDLQHLFTNVKVPSPSKLHVLDGLMAFTQRLGVPATSPKWSLDYPAEARSWSEGIISQDSKRNLVIVPAASKGYKNWTAEGYAQVIQHAVELGWNIILGGSPAQIEIELGEQIERLCPNLVTNLIGQTDIMQMLALIDRADLVLAPDTGPTHMANAIATPVIGLYAHHNPLRTGPYNYQKYVVSAYEEAIIAETGKPSSELEWRTRVKDKQAMQRIQPQQVIDMFDLVCHEEKL
ncbi:glycosyltransferase family 9 protein [Vibrio maritimus]|uniref:glycosyltransferase family 9 protein n=1 Tax=Vibrio maritimus TaxID=990268 RepID=UPI003734CA1F